MLIDSQLDTAMTVACRDVVIYICEDKRKLPTKDILQVSTIMPYVQR